MRKVGRFGLSIALILTTFTFVSAPQIAHGATSDTDQAVKLTASTLDYAATASMTPYAGASPMTLEAWANSSDLCASSAIVAGFESTYVIFCNTGYWATSLYTTNNSYWNTTNSTIPVRANEWVHIALTRDASNGWKFYVNGELNKSGTLATVGGTTGSFLVGALPSRQYWNGMVDEVKYWSVTRTQSQIQSDMSTFGSGGDSGLQLYFNFNDVVGSGIKTTTNLGALSGKDLTTGTSTGAPTFPDIKTVDTSTVSGYSIVKFPRTYINSNGGWTPPANINSVDYLVVGGGGGAGWNSGGGGSGGGVDSATAFSVSGVQTVIVGDAGAPAISSSVNGGTGGASAFGSINVNGGNGGIGFVNTSTRPAGGISVQGSGFGGYGTQNTGYVAQSGGAGPISSITGTATNYAGGGGGGGWTTEVGGGGGAGGGGAGGGASPGNGTTSGTSGTTNTGGGGGANSASGGTAGSGGSGIVIIKYKNYFGASVTISVNPKKTTKSAGATAITASTTSASGSITFYANGKIINGCKNLTVSGSSATCNWRPMVHGSVTLTATFTPSGDATLSGSVSSAAITTAVTKRTTAR